MIYSLSFNVLLNVLCILCFYLWYNMIIVYHTKFIKLEEYSYDEYYNVLSQIYTVIKNDNSLNTMLYLDLYACLYQDYYSEMVLHGKEYNKWYYIRSLPLINQYIINYLFFLLLYNIFLIWLLSIGLFLKGSLEWSKLSTSLLISLLISL